MLKLTWQCFFFLSEVQNNGMSSVTSIFESMEFIGNLLDTWESSSFSPFSIFFSSFFPQECKTFHGVFVGSACSLHGPYIPDVLFWCVILFFTTFFLSSFLKQFKTKRYFPTKVIGMWFWSPDNTHVLVFVTLVYFRTVIHCLGLILDIK